MKKCIINMRDESGMALLITLMIIAILAAIAFQFNYITRVDHSMAANLWDETKAYYLTKSGYQVALALLSEKPPEEDGVDHLGQEWATFQGSDLLSNYQIDEGLVKVQIIDEDRKININSIIEKDGQRIVQFRYMQLVNLFELLGIDIAKIDAILDWIDRGQGDERRPYGAEDEDYLQGPTPYPCKDGPLDDLSELTMIMGMKEELDIDRGKGKRLIDFLTIAPTNGTININTADRIVIQTLSEFMDKSLAQSIIERREEVPFRDISELKAIPGMDKKGQKGITLFDEIKDRISVSSNVFSIRVKGQVNRASKEIHVTVKKEKGDFKIFFWKVL